MDEAHSRPKNGGRLLVGIGNPETVDDLMQLAVCIAAYADYEIVAAHVVTVPPQASLASGRDSVEVAQARDLVGIAVYSCSGQKIRVRGLVEVAREVDEGIISATASQNAQLVLVGYSDDDTEAEGSEKAFDRAMHRVAREIRCDLVAAKFRKKAMNRLVIPILTEVNLRLVALLARAIVAGKGADVTFLHVIEEESEREQAERDASELLQAHRLDDLGPLRVVVGADSVATAVDIVNEYDVAIVGAVPDPSLAESIFGTWAQRLAARTESTVLVVRAEQQ